MSTPTPKRTDLKPTPRLAEFRFTEIYTLGKMLVLHTETNRIQCKLDNKDLIKTTEKYLKDSLTQYADYDKEVICTEMCNILLDSINQQLQDQQQQQEQEQQAVQNMLNEINQLREQNPNLTHEEWQIKLNEKFDYLRNIVRRIMPEVWDGLAFELSVSKVLNIKDCTLPVIGIILGRPSSTKSVIIDLMRKWINVYSTDDFTAKAFVTHTTSVNTEEELERIDMLPRIKNKLFLTPELSPLFTKKEEDLAQQLGIIIKIADGKGYSNDSGAHGHRGYEGEYMFVWVGAAVEIPYKVFKILHKMGPRLYFYRMKYDDKSDAEFLEKLRASQKFNDRFKEMQDALHDYLKWFEIGPNLTRINDDSPGKMEWTSEDNNDVLEYIIRLGRLLSHLRCVARTWETKDTQGTGYAYSISLPEDPSRANTILYNIARGHALLYGRNYVTRDDLPIVVHIVMSTAQIERVSTFSLLVANNGKLNTDEILNSLNVSRPTALRTIEEFKAVGLATIQETVDGRGRPIMSMVLKPEFEWLLTDDLIKKKCPYTPIISNGNGEASYEKLWVLYDELEKEEEATNFSQVDKNTISRAKLVDTLEAIASYSKEDANQMIEDAIKDGKLEQPLLGTLRKTGQ